MGLRWVFRHEDWGVLGVEKGRNTPNLQSLAPFDKNLQGFGCPCRARSLFLLVLSWSTNLIVLRGNLSPAV